MVYTEKDIDTLARTLYGEAEVRNEADAHAIAFVIRNRTLYPNWPNSIAAVCLQPWQFSCWNQNDPNRHRILEASGNWFERCKAIAAEVLSCTFGDVSKGSTHYYETGIKAPAWAKGHKPVYQVSHNGGKTAHWFFNDIDTKPPQTAAEALDQIQPVSATPTVSVARAGVVSAGAVSLATEAVNNLAPAFPLAQTVVQCAPWVIAAGLVLVIGYMVWRRIADRKAGLR